MPTPPHSSRTRGYLPHWESADATYAVTFRLADSLPQSVLNAYLTERRTLLEPAQQQNRPLTPHEHARLHFLFSEKIDHYLDQGDGACHLNDPAIADIVSTALQHFHNQRYELLTWCVMPNHVHALLHPHPENSLDKIFHTWKSFTAKQANKILNRTGPFWMPEYYDHLIRDHADLTHNHTYILNNPKKAHLENWPWQGTIL